MTQSNWKLSKFTKNASCVKLIGNRVTVLANQPPGSHLPLPTLSLKDLGDIKTGLKDRCRRRGSIHGGQSRKLDRLKAIWASRPPIIAKVETAALLT
jgi:hypothetical protein